MKQLMDHYNACAVFSSSKQVSVSDVFDSTSNIWVVHSSLHMLRCAQGSVPLSAKHDMIMHFLLKKKSLEESELIQVEMANTLQYLYSIGMIFEHKIRELKDAEQTEFTRGSISLLCNRHAANQFLLNQAVVTLSESTVIPANILPACAYTQHDSVSDHYSDDSLSDSDF